MFVCWQEKSNKTILLISLCEENTERNSCSFFLFYGFMRPSILKAE